MKNINSAESADNLINLVMTTIAINFDVKCGFFAYYNKENNRFLIKEGINIDSNFSFEVNDELISLLKGEVAIIYREEDVREQLQINSTFVVNASGAVLLPVYIEDMEINLLGIIGILNTGDSVLMSEENLIKFESIANHVAPVLYQLQYVENVKRHYEPHYRNNFISVLNQEINEANEFILDLFVIHIEYTQKNLFKNMPILELLMKHYQKVFPINGTNVLIIVNDIERCREAIELVSAELYKLNIYKFKEDFQTSEEFIESV